MEPTSKRGPKDSRGVMAERIVDAARAAFAARGYDGVSMRAVGHAAGVDPRLVGYYFESKDALLEACLVPPPGFLESVAEVARSDLDSRGEALVRSLLRFWTHPESAVVLRSIILIAAQHDIALQRLRLIVTGSLIGAVATNLDDEQRALRGGLVATQSVSTYVGYCLGMAVILCIATRTAVTLTPAENALASFEPTAKSRRR